MSVLLSSFFFFSSFFKSDICSRGSRSSCNYKRFGSEQSGVELQGVQFWFSTLMVLNWYGTCPRKASWIPDRLWAVFSQNCSRVVWNDRRGAKGWHEKMKRKIKSASREETAQVIQRKRCSNLGGFLAAIEMKCFLRNRNTFWTSTPTETIGALNYRGRCCDQKKSYF